MRSYVINILKSRRYMRFIVCKNFVYSLLALQKNHYNVITVLFITSQGKGQKRCPHSVFHRGWERIFKETLGARHWCPCNIKGTFFRMVWIFFSSFTKPKLMKVVDILWIRLFVLFLCRDNMDQNELVPEGVLSPLNQNIEVRLRHFDISNNNKAVGLILTQLVFLLNIFKTTVLPYMLNKISFGLNKPHTSI